ncbi:MAG TPA: 4-hydroxy-tetrahydrodipicolinate synthase [Parasegetibacter sp.]
MSLQSILRGTGVAVVTPFDAQENVDFASLEKIINHLIEGGVEYIVTLGTTGETPTLTRKEKIEIAKFTIDKVNNRVPVVVGAGGNNTKEVIQEIQELPLDKAVAVLSAAPYYNKPSQEGIYQHYKAIAENSPLPVILYNVPGRTGRNMSADTTIRLAREVKNIAGIKEASGDMAQCMQILKDRPSDFLVVSGDDALVLPQIACGMEGVISVAANAFPKEFSDMVRASLKFDFATAKKINDSLMKAYDIMFAENNPAGIKAFMAKLGLLENKLRLPVVSLSEGLNKEMLKYMEAR